MNILDYIILAILLLFILLGVRKRFLKSLGALLGLVVAAIVASRIYPIIASWLGDTNSANIISFVLIFAITIKLVSMLFWLLGKIFEVVTVLPFISTFDKILGLILGLVEGIFVLSIVLYFLGKYPINDWLTFQLTESVISGVLLKIGTIFIPLFPEAMKTISSFM